MFADFLYNTYANSFFRLKTFLIFVKILVVFILLVTSIRIIL